MTGPLTAGALAEAWKRDCDAHRRWVDAGNPVPDALRALVSRGTSTAPRVTPLSPSALEPAPSTATFERLEAFGALVLEANKSLNLVSRRDPAAQIATNILDSLPFAAIWDDVSRETGPDDEPPLFVLDAGSGSGVPGIPTQLLLAERGVAPALLLVESRGHKADFLDGCLDALSLERAGVWGGRLEDPSLPEWLEDEGWTAPGCLVTRALASVVETLHWTRGLTADEWLNRACLLKGAPGLAREWADEGKRWTKTGWRWPGIVVFQACDRPLCLLRGDRS